MRVNTNPPVDPRRVAYEAVIADAMRKPFVWGEHDCVTFVGAAVLALTGRDILDGLEWSNEREALRLIDSMGGLQAAFTSRLGDPMPALMARAGDVVLAKDEDRPLMAVCHGPNLVSTGPLGLAVLPLSAGLCAWRVRGGSAVATPSDNPLGDKPIEAAVLA